MKRFILTDEWMGAAHELMTKEDLDKLEALGEGAGYRVGEHIELEPHEDGTPQYFASNVTVIGKEDIPAETTWK